MTLLALPDDMPVALPADDVHEVGDDAVIAHQRVEHEGERTDDDDDHDHPQKGLGVQVEDFAGIGRCQHAHYHADEDRHQRIGNGADSDEADADGKGGFELGDEVGDEGSEAHGRLAIFGQGYGRIEIVEEVDDAVEHFLLIVLSRA
jgi:hypothetical protein